MSGRTPLTRVSPSRSETPEPARPGSPELTGIPLFEFAEDSSTSPPAGPTVPFGVFTASQVADRRSALPLQEVDWAQVVTLRKEASSSITDQTQDYIAESGRPMPTEDRLLMGRATIRHVVADHVRALHRDGAALWSTDTEFAYVHAMA